MRIQKLVISEFRGIRYLEHDPEGKSLIVCGPNGTGKSGIVDAVEFLISGDISRLSGVGTGGITVTKHGKHVTATGETYVQAEVILSKGLRAIIKRSIPDTELVCISGNELVVRSELDKIRGQRNSLSRKEILKYITTAPKDRGEQINSLLNLKAISDVRSKINSHTNALNRDIKISREGFSSAKINLATASGITTYDEEKINEVISTYLGILGLNNISQIDPSIIKRSVSPADLTRSHMLETIELIEQELQSDRAEKRKTIAGNCTSLLRKSRILQEDINKLSNLDIKRKALNVLGDEENCPLCDSAWPPGELKSHLINCIKELESVSRIVEEIEELISPIINSSREVGHRFNSLIVSLCKIDQSFEEQCKELEAAVTLFMEKTTPIALLSSDAENLDMSPMFLLGLPSDWFEIISGWKKMIGVTEEIDDPKAKAIESLIKIREHQQLLETAKNKLETTEKNYEKFKLLDQYFIEARDETLNELYEKIKERFVNLYRIVHSEDEGAFNANIIPTPSGLDFEVDFHGQGMFPPHAFHSEGHQDSMGLCLYLALTEYICGGQIDLLILDDVVMSVDAGHRKGVCKLLREQFPSTQLVITTHERAWAEQLRSHHIATRNNCLNFYSWSLQTGPMHDKLSEAWPQIKEELTKNNVNTAASTLRRTLESFYRDVCANLAAKVVFNERNEWSLSDFLPSAYSRLDELLSKAIKAERSHGNEEKVYSIEEHRSILQQCYEKAQVEQWAINRAVHFTNWENFQREDFEPVVNAMEELCEQFRCSECRDALEIKRDTSFQTVNLSCSCQKVDMRLK